MLETDAWERLRQFRKKLYDNLGLRQDSLFELLDAVLTTPQRCTLVRLSLSTMFRRRRWPSTCDALADGSIDVAAVRQLFVRELPTTVTLDNRPLWVIDGTNWPRPAARASADRTWEYRPLPGWPQSGIVPAWAYQWLVGRAGCGWQLGTATGCPTPRTDGGLGHVRRPRPDRDGAPSPIPRRATPGGHVG